MNEIVVSNAKIVRHVHFDMTQSNFLKLMEVLEEACITARPLRKEAATQIFESFIPVRDMVTGEKNGNRKANNDVEDYFYGDE